MSDMSASVILKLVDEMTGPARKMQATLRGIIKDVERLNQLSGRHSGASQFEGMIRGIKQADAAAKKLRQTMAHPIATGFAAPAVSSIGRVTRAANAATKAVGSMNQAVHRSGGGGMFKGGFSNFFGAGRRGHGGVGRGGGGPHLPGAGLVHSFKHALAFRAAEGVIDGVRDSVRTSFEQASELQHVRAMLRVQGESSATVEEVIKSARAMAQVNPSFTTAQHAAAIAELRPAMVGGIKEAMALAPQFQQAVAVLDAVKGAGRLKGVDSHGEALDLARALELKGVMGDGAKAIRSYTDGMIKSVVAFNGQLTAGDFHAAMKFGRGATRGWSEEFVTQYLPTIMNDLKPKGGSASSAGNALASFSRTVIDRVMQQSAMVEWDRLGLVDKSKIERGKGGIKGIGIGGIVGWERAMANPYAWLQNTLLPAIKRKNGGKDPKEAQIIAELGQLFGNRVAQSLAQIMAVQKAQIEKDAENVRKAMGIDGLRTLWKLDSTARINVLSASLKDLGGALGDIAMPGAMRGIKGVIDWAHSLRNSIASSTYMSGLGGRFESLVAGMFGQRLGRRQMANGREREYWSAGQMLGDGWSKLTTAGGGLLRVAEEVGAVTTAVKAMGVACMGAAGVIETAKSTINKVRDVANSNGVKELTEAAAKATQGALSVVGLDEASRKDIHGAGRRNQGLYNSLHPQVGPPAPPPRQWGRNGSTAPSLWDNLRKLIFPVPALNGAGTRFGVNGPASFLPDPKAAVAPIAAAANSIVPTFLSAGQSAGSALEGGFATGASAVTGKMSALMSNLAAMASAGVAIAVRLDSSAAEAQLAGLISRAGSIKPSIGGAAGRSQYSGSMHDLGQ